LIVTETNPTQVRAEDEPLPLRAEFLMRLCAELEPAQPVGDTPLGLRQILYVKGGEFSGPRVKGKLLPGGGDWLLKRTDDVFQLDVRITLCTDDGALIFVTYRGISTITPEVRQRILKGEVVDASQYYFRTTPYFETASQRYAWLNRLVAVGVGKRNSTSVEYSIYAIM
jgi:hypothetical protein